MLRPKMTTACGGTRDSCPFMPPTARVRSVCGFTAGGPRRLASCRMEWGPSGPVNGAAMPSNRANPGMRSLVSSVPRHRRKRKIRRTGQHTAPSQVEKVAQTAGKAAPAVVVVGTIATAAPQIHGSTTAKPTVTATHSVPARLDAAMLPAHPASRGDATRSGAGRSYTVRAGDTLSGIAQRFYGSAGRLARAVRGEPLGDQRPQPDLRGPATPAAAAPARRDQHDRVHPAARQFRRGGQQRPRPATPARPPRPPACPAR